jgi:hypothetical protein
MFGRLSALAAAACAFHSPAHAQGRTDDIFVDRVYKLKTVQGLEPSVLARFVAADLVEPLSRSSGDWRFLVEDPQPDTRSVTTARTGVGRYRLSAGVNDRSVFFEIRLCRRSDGQVRIAQIGRSDGEGRSLRGVAGLKPSDPVRC